MENENLFKELNSVCDKYSAPHIGTVAFNELCGMYMGANPLHHKDNDPIIRIPIARVSESRVWNQFLIVTGLTLHEISSAPAIKLNCVDIKQSHARKLGLII